MMNKQISLVLALSLLMSVPAFADSSTPATPTTSASAVQVATADFEGTITDITNKQITVRTSVKNPSYETIVFNLSRNTKFENCHLTELETGNSIIVTHSLAMTRSAVPQAAALSLELVQTTNEIVKVPMKRYEFEGKVTKIVEGDDETRITVTAKGSKGASKSIVFIITANTDVEDEDDETLEVGATVEVTYLYASKQFPTTAVEALSIELD